LFDACDALGGFPSPDLFLAGIEAERDLEISERGPQVAFALIGLCSISVGVEVLRKQPDRGVEFHEGQIVFALRQVIATESIVDARMIGIERRPSFRSLRARLPLRT
jgi:hypothetical protein